MKKHISQLFLVISTFVISLFAFATSAFATDVDVPKDVAREKTIDRWFYWPGWAFAALVILVVALVASSYWKNVLGPKKRGRKIS